MYLHINAVERLPIHIVSFINWGSSKKDMGAIDAAYNTGKPYNIKRITDPSLRSQQSVMNRMSFKTSSLTVTEWFLHQWTAILWNSSLMVLWALNPGNTTKMWSRLLSAGDTFLMALQRGAFPICSTSPMSYRKLSLARKRRAKQSIWSDLRACWLCDILEM